MPGIRRAMRQETEEIMHSDPLYWLKNLVISGREGEDDEGNDEGDEGDDTGDDGEEGEDQEGGEDSSDDEDDPVKLKERLAKADEALKKERKLRREAQRDARAKAKKKAETDEGDEQEDKDKSRLQTKLQKEQERNQKLATGLRNRAIDDAIKEAAREAGFIDPTDALLDSVRAEVDYEQNDDDPSDIDIDLESVEDAVKDLASRKKHLIGQGQPGSRSGGKFRKKNQTDDEGPSLTKLQKDYPSLR